MPRGRKPQPNAVKQAKGETRPSRLPAEVVEFPKAERVPDPPEWLTYESAVDLWKELAPLLLSQKILANVDVHALGHLCQLHGKILDDYDRRLSPKASEVSQLRTYFAEFGLTPSSRTRVTPVGGGEKKNPFEGNGRKASSRSD
jgi:phage terminase small subunit